MQNIIDITLENFQQVILQESQNKIVMVDFWAEWCEPCKDLTPVLEKLAGEYSDKMLLAKVDCEAQQEIAAQFGVRSLPTVILVKDGQPIDGFAGAQPEGQIREMLDKHLPKPEDELFAQAAELYSQGDFQQAFTPVKQAYEHNQQRADIKFMLADCYIELGSIAQAKTLLETVGLADQNAQYQALLGKIQLAEQAAESPEIQALQQQLADDPDNMQLKVDLAVQLHQANKAQEALELLYAVVSKDMGFGDARKVMLDVINALPDGDALKSSYRRKIYSLMY